MPPATVPAPGQALQATLAAVRLEAAATQDGLASLMANVLRATAAGNLPPAVQTAMQQLMALHIATDKTPDAAAVKNAMLNSGLFTEAMLAAGMAPADLKAALGQLQQAAQRWLGKAQANAQQSGAPNVPPPVRGGAPMAQYPAQPSLPENADPALTATLLANGSEAALARETLMQMASLPEQNKPGETRWMFDVPLMTPHGAAVAQMIVTRDHKGSSPDAPDPVWRVGLAINIEPLGPVRANLALSGDHAWVTIGADRPESLDKLARNSSWLTDALTAVTLDADIAFQSGAGTPRAYGSLVDRAS
ncbi:flagellar hook-length control protein FliK [Rhizomicrobium electricum]|uniref:flagellar hook-length control protein FliK n=1 Tax=Rhizomicrobium electricum TaxID=480070 RepID=UPI00142242B1|nr:hypothetical protein [Rhizomicrobium electricum]